MNWRVRIVSIFIILLFAGFAFYYFRLYVSPKKHSIILFVAPGVTPELLASSWRDAKSFKALGDANQTAFVQSDELSDYASLMTQVASKQPGKIGQLGLDPSGRPLDTLLYRAQRANRSIGIISSASLTSPGVAAFFSHTKDAFNNDEIALQIFDSTDIDLIFGGGGRILDHAIQASGRDLFKESEEKGYHIIRSKKELEETQAWKPGKLLGVFSQDPLPFRAEAANDAPTLSDLTRRAIQKLQYNLGGYFLIIEHDLIAQAPIELTNEELMELDNAVRTAIDYAGKNTLVLVYFPSADLGWLFLYGADLPELKSIIHPAGIYRIIASEL